MLKRVAIVSVLLSALIGTHASACDKEPIVEFVNEPYKAGSDMQMVAIVVDGKKWTHRYIENRAKSAFGPKILPDCRVLVIGRKGLSFFIVIEDEEWQNFVYNSTFFKVSKDGKKVLQADYEDPPTIIVNDVVQANSDGTLKNVYFDDTGNVITKWLVDGKEVTMVNGKQ